MGVFRCIHSPDRNPSIAIKAQRDESQLAPLDFCVLRDNHSHERTGYER